MAVLSPSGSVEKEHHGYQVRARVGPTTVDLRAHGHTVVCSRYLCLRVLVHAPAYPTMMTATTRLASVSSSPASNGPPSLDLQNDPTTRTQTTTRRRRALPSPLTLTSCQDSGHGSGPCISQLGNDIFLSTSGMRSNRHARHIPSPPPLSLVLTHLVTRRSCPRCTVGGDALSPLPLTHRDVATTTTRHFPSPSSSPRDDGVVPFPFPFPFPSLIHLTTTSTSPG